MSFHVDCCDFIAESNEKNFIISRSKNVQLTGDFPGIIGCVYVYYANEMEIRVCAAIAISQVVCK